MNVLIYVPYTTENYPLDSVINVVHSHLITGQPVETCAATPPPMNALVALGGIANKRQLVVVLKHCNQTNESTHFLKLFYLKFSYIIPCLLDELIHV